MKDFPNDIIHKVKNDFKKEDWKLVFDELIQVNEDSLNVGQIQLIRSMISLSEGNRYKILNFRKDRYFGDPRDLISLANNLNPKSDSGRRPFETGELKKGWVSEYWTTNRNLERSEIVKVDKWIYENIFTKDQSNLKPKLGSNIEIYQSDELEGETLGELIRTNNPFSKLPNQKEFEVDIYSRLKSLRKETSCYTFSFYQSPTYNYDVGIIGEYEFENKAKQTVGNGILYPLYTNLFNDDIGNSYKNNYALGTGLISKEFDWFVIIHFKNEIEKYIETLIGGQISNLNKR